MKKKWSAGTILTQLFLLVWLLLCLFPLYWMFTMSLKDTNEIFGPNPVGLPTQWLWGNYASAWGSGGRISNCPPTACCGCGGKGRKSFSPIS